MKPDREGFTLIELMIVVALIAIISSLIIPNLLGARLQANETAAISTLRNIASCQAQFQCTNWVDVNSNGTGEYGYLAEMSGGCPPRSKGSVIYPPILSARFKNISAGRIQSSGYNFWLLLPDSLGRGIGEFATGGYDPGNPPDPNFAEVVWACYAWPQKRNVSGNRAFLINHEGDILQTDNDAPTQNYSGNTGPQPDAAFLSPSTAGSILGSLAVNTVATDGGFWKAID